MVRVRVRVRVMRLGLGHAIFDLLQKWGRLVIFLPNAI